MTRRIDISHRTIIFVALFALLAWVIYLIIDIILLVFVAFILMSALSPTVERLVKWGVPRAVAIALIFVILVSSLVGLVTIGLSPLSSQTTTLTQRLAETINSLIQTNLIDRSIINDELSNLSRQVISFTLQAVQNLIGFLSVIVITFYLLLDKEKFEDYVSSLFIGKKERVQYLIKRIEDKLGAWLRGQLVLSVAVGTLVYVALTIIGIEFALPLAIIAGLLEVVPVIGPIISAVPAVLLALTVSPLMAAIVTGVYLAIQQLENHIIVPQVMRRAVGLNPLLVILAVTVGGRLLGIGGALLAVPIAVVTQLVIEGVLNPEEDAH